MVKSRRSVSEQSQICIRTEPDLHEARGSLRSSSPLRASWCIPEVMCLNKSIIICYYCCKLYDFSVNYRKRNSKDISEADQVITFWRKITKNTFFLSNNVINHTIRPGMCFVTVTESIFTLTSMLHVFIWHPFIFRMKYFTAQSLLLFIR